MNTLSATNVLRIAAVTTALIAMLFGLIAVSAMKRAETVFSPIVAETVPRMIEIERLGLPIFEAATTASRIIASPTDVGVVEDILILKGLVATIDQSANNPMLSELSIIERMPIAATLVANIGQAARLQREAYAEAQKEIVGYFADTQLLRERITRDQLLKMNEARSLLISEENIFSDISTLSAVISELREIQTNLDYLSNFETTEDIDNSGRVIRSHINDLFLKISRLSDVDERNEYALLARDIFIGFLDGTSIQTSLKAGRLRSDMIVSASEVVNTLNSLKAEMANLAENQRLSAMTATDDMKQEFAQARTTVLFASLATVLAILGVVFATIEYRIVRRLRVLDSQMASLSEGDLAPQLKVNGTDELAQLSLAVEDLRQATKIQKITENNLRDATKKAKQASKLKTDFLSMMSHEVRTPLNAIMGIFELIENAPDHRRNKIRAHHGRSAAEGMFAMLSKVLDAARLEAGQTEVVKKDIKVDNIRHYIEGVLEGAISKSAANINSRVVFETSLPSVISTDEGFIQQILTNLLDNAVRFTEKGAISVRAFSKGLEKDQRIVFEVEDTGIGIEPEHTGVIFDQFHQVDGGITRKRGGSGLGLAITKQLTEQLGGKIQVTGLAGSGAKFSVELPLS